MAGQGLENQWVVVEPILRVGRARPDILDNLAMQIKDITGVRVGLPGWFFKNLTGICAAKREHDK